MADELKSLMEELDPEKAVLPIEKPKELTTIETTEEGGAVLLTIESASVLPADTRQKLATAMLNSAEVASYVANSSPDSILCNAYFRQIKDTREWRLSVKPSASAVPALMETATLTFQQPIRLTEPQVVEGAEKVMVKVSAKKFAIGKVEGKLTELEIGSAFGMATEALKDHGGDIDRAVKSGFSKARRDAVIPLLPISVIGAFFNKALELGKVETISLTREKRGNDWYTVAPPDIYKFLGLKPAAISPRVIPAPFSPAVPPPVISPTPVVIPARRMELATVEQVSRILVLSQNPPMSEKAIERIGVVVNQWEDKEIPDSDKQLTKEGAAQTIQVMEAAFKKANIKMPEEVIVK